MTKATIRIEKVIYQSTELYYLAVKHWWPLWPIYIPVTELGQLDTRTTRIFSSPYYLIEYLMGKYVSVGVDQIKIFDKREPAKNRTYNYSRMEGWYGTYKSLESLLQSI